MRRLAALAFAALCGCTPLEWVRPDTSPEQFQADMNDCRARAWHEASLRASWNHFFYWPGAPFADAYGHQLMEESRLTQFCMESKGYALQPVPKP